MTDTIENLAARLAVVEERLGLRLPKPLDEECARAVIGIALTVHRPNEDDDWYIEVNNPEISGDEGWVIHAHKAHESVVVDDGHDDRYIVATARARTHAEMHTDLAGLLASIAQGRI